jgi:protein O-GlcNAc transferase
MTTVGRDTTSKASTDVPMTEGRRRARVLLAALVVLLALLGLTRLLLRSPARTRPGEAEALLRQGMERHWRGDLRGAADAFQRAVGLVPDWPDAHLQLGATYYDAREYDLARRELERGVALAPDEAVGWGQLGKLNLTTGRLEDAEKALQRAVQLRPDRATYHALLGEAYRQRGDPQSERQAEAAFREALALNPQNAEAYHRLGLLYQRQGRLGEAAVALEAATRCDPRRPEPYYALAQVQRRLGRPDAADRAGRAFQRLEQQQRADQERRERARTAGDGASGRRGEWETGRVGEKDGSALSPRLPVASSPTRSIPPEAAALLAEGRRAFYHFSQPDRAIELFQQARQADPANPDVPYNLGLVFHFVGRLEEAEAAFRQALALNPQNPRYHAWIGTLHLERGPAELDAAIAALRRSVELGPDYAYGHYQLGRAYLLQNRPAEAAAALSRTVALNPRYREAYYSLGQAYLRLGKREPAQRALATFRRLDALERERRRRAILSRVGRP